MEFVPRAAPEYEDPKMRELARWVENEFRRLTFTLTETGDIRFQVLNVAPTRPREGMVVWADGTNWNPGSGAGPYARIAGAWVKLKP